MDLIWSGISITVPNEQGCQGDREIGIMDERMQSTYTRIGEKKSLILLVHMETQVER